MTGKYRIVTDAEIEPERLDGFLRRCFSTEKCDFLRDWGEWRHRGKGNRFVVIDGSGETVGYFACIPTEIKRGDDIYPAVWWLDLYIPPEHQGKGIQGLTDERARRHAGLHLGFPNHLAAMIHQKHGWGIRADFRVRMLPFIPQKLPQLRKNSGVKSLLYDAAAIILSPVMRLWNLRLLISGEENVSGGELPEPSRLAEVFQFHPPEMITVNRSEDYLRWRFHDSPHRTEYRCFLGLEKEKTPRIAVITRNFQRGGVKITRILDVFGDLQAEKLLRETLKSAAKDALMRRSVYMTCLAANKALDSALKRLGFIFRTSTRLRWLSEDEGLMNMFRQGACHWSLADSDNDSID